ncbi:MAG: Hpt domain-containing protein, partial [Proteobacteria bacterium]|nr:Hpt domain-containing protein [Pseudomonadota bacterium]
MALDMDKYRNLFLEEAGEHLGEMSRALLELEKDSGSVDSIDTLFRMAHSIKSMAASLGYDSISEVSHALEDRMEEIRRAGQVSQKGELSLLFRGLEGLESMVGVVRETGEAPPSRAELVEALANTPDAAAPESPVAVEPEPAPKKKLLSPLRP